MANFRFTHLPHTRIKSFTIYELLIVLGMMSLLIGIIGSSINLLSQRMKVSVDIQEGVINFYRVRSNLWLDCYYADSIEIKDQNYLLWRDGEPVCYKQEKGKLYRSVQFGEWLDLGFKVERFNTFEVNNSNMLSIVFDFNPMRITFRYPVLSSVKQRIDRHFLQNELK